MIKYYMYFIFNLNNLDRKSPCGLIKLNSQIVNNPSGKEHFSRTPCNCSPGPLPGSRKGGNGPMRNRKGWIQKINNTKRLLLSFES